eukprot:CAMPEP_0183522084 /NCGR_PEP_ID=MMETSP0371-20130417/18164_1 /TAXON_ID=268820 /ORGANISM="Peridinium aciculiferum, Strain PAER-2" /LENGTH=373 /DNA_ID=CAMNT_0025720775 /DNA_START=31 /DNA_END=1152 /DNA_ORIENTATION=+
MASHSPHCILLVSLLLGASCPTPCFACSGWVMENDFRLSGRTLDNSPSEWLGRQGSGVAAVPRGTAGALGLRSFFGYVGFFALPNNTVAANTLAQEHVRMAALNEVGLSCDEQHLSESEYQTPIGDPSVDLPTHLICEWAAMNFRTCQEVREGLGKVKIVRGRIPGGADSGHHYTFRDASGASLVVEVVGGQVNAYDDLNDGGKTGFGVITNSPPFPWQLESLRFLQQKRTFARPGTAVPGAWYSDERFIRIWLVKSGMPRPRNLAAAVAQAFTVMDVVTIPMGLQMGTDSTPGDEGDYTIWGAVYDHLRPAVYWRTAENYQPQRLSLADLDLREGAPRRYLKLNSTALTWFADASPALLPVARGSTGAEVLV